jgi:phenylpropionate dioxygenase-like ring-hydroxylating dioxygenase large terminal subunit
MIDRKILEDMMGKPAESLELWEGVKYQDVLDQDERDGQKIPPILRERRELDLGSYTVPASRYTDPEFYKREVKGVFLRTWQYAVREEEIPNEGDSYVFDLAGRSAIVARQADGSIKAIRNVCRHRGRKLLTQGGCKQRYRCPYHGFTWNLDGSFRQYPAIWDFPEIDPDNFALPEIRCETWAGFVFVNFDLNARPLLEVLDPLPRHFETWRMSEFYKSAHIAKVMPANWKAVCEAFIENLHVAATHPQLSCYTNDANSQYDILSDHVGRTTSATGFAGLLYDGPVKDDVTMVKKMFEVGTRAGNAQLKPHDPTMSARRYLADVGRQMVAATVGRDASDISDAELIDPVSYDLFPNFHPWGGIHTRLCYRFRPLDHERTLMEVMLFSWSPKDGPCPPPAKMRTLSEDEPWSSAHELGFFSGIFGQDEANMAPVQEGLRDLGEEEIHFGRYTEVRCRNLHRMVDRYIAEYEAQS